MLTIELPFPPAGLFPNRSAGKHWSATRALRDKYYSDAYTLTFQAVNAYKGPWYSLTGDIPISITFSQPDKRGRDADGMLSAIKNGLDGIATALTVNDKQFFPITIKRGEVVKGGLVMVEIGA